jgi:4-aminobutyrate aminotransferase-like enzyme
LGAQVLSSNQKQREWISNYSSETVHIPFPYDYEGDLDPVKFLADSLRELASRGINIENDVCGFMLETFQGWGAFFYPKEYVKAIREICDTYDILLTFDEMQSGFGRTGKNFGYQHYEVRADLICCGKGMGGGLPISGVIGKKEVMDLPDIGNMSSTHSGNPLLAKVGHAVIEELIDKDLVIASENKGKLLHSELNLLKNNFPDDIKLINGKGLIAAVIFSEKYKEDPYKSLISQITEKCFQKGLLVVHTGRESIKIGPPLTISESAISEGVQVLNESIEEVLRDKQV